MLITKTNNINLGDCKSGITKYFDIVLDNTSTTDLKFTVSASCGCTKPVFPKSKIKGGESLVGKASFKPGRGKGKTGKTITFTWTDPTSQTRRTHKFHFSATIV